MFGQFLFVRIRRAQQALADGRVDEAYTIAIQPDVREHPRGRKLLAALERPLLARARLHLQAGRHREALLDLERLCALDRGGSELDELRQRALAGLQTRQDEVARVQQEVVQAIAAVRAGHLETARIVVRRISDTARKHELEHEIDLRLQRSSQLLAEAQAALERGEVLAAVRLWAELIRRHGRTDAADQFAHRLAAACRQSLQDWFAAGKLEHFFAAQEVLDPLREVDPTLRSHQQVAALCLKAAGQLARREYSALRETLLRLRGAAGPAEWLDRAAEAADRIAQSHDELLAGPLGLMMSLPAASQAATVVAEAALQARGKPQAPPKPLADWPLLLLVDGAGSSLLIDAARVRIGRAGGSRPVDVALPVDLESHHADIIRRGEDYFLTAYGPVQVNGRPVREALLRDGDRIELGVAAKFTFCQPSMRSSSAVLRLSHRCRLAEDVSSVILFCQTCLIGPQAHCHVRGPEGVSQVVLFTRGTELYARPLSGGRLADAVRVAPGQTLEFGEIRLTVQRYGQSGGRG